MCTNFVPSVRQEIAALQPAPVHMPEQDWPEETYPGYDAPILLRNAHGALECRVAQFGLVPRWCKDAAQAQSMGRKTYNARSETAAEKPSYRGPWLQRQWALAPMRAFFEPCWEEAHRHGGRAVRWKIQMADGSPFAVAGLWEHWVHPQNGKITHSFTLLTVNADGHAILGRMHRPGEEKRMPAILTAQDYTAWLAASPGHALQFLRPWDATRMLAGPASAVPEQPQQDCLW